MKRTGTYQIPVAEVAGFEPTCTGVKVPCLNRLATPLYLQACILRRTGRRSLRATVLFVSCSIHG